MRATVRVTGTVRGTQIDKGAEAELQTDALVLAWHEAGPWRVALDGVDGVTASTRECTLHLAGGDTLELTGDERVRAIADEIVRRACVVPELTRGLRSLGSLRGAPGAAHDRWFAPLLAARRALEAAGTVDTRVAAVNAGAFRAEMERAMQEIAATHAPGNGAEARAIEAILEDESDDLFAALDRLDAEARDLARSSPATRIAAWRRWVERVRAVFVAADEAWARARREL